MLSFPAITGTSHLKMMNMTSGPNILHRFKLSQNAPLSDLFISNCLSCFNFLNIVSNCGRMQH